MNDQSRLIHRALVLVGNLIKISTNDIMVWWHWENRRPVFRIYECHYLIYSFFPFQVDKNMSGLNIVYDVCYDFRRKSRWNRKCRHARSQNTLKSHMRDSVCMNTRNQSFTMMAREYVKASLRFAKLTDVVQDIANIPDVVMKAIMGALPWSTEMEERRTDA